MSTIDCYRLLELLPLNYLRGNSSTILSTIFYVIVDISVTLEFAIFSCPLHRLFGSLAACRTAVQPCRSDVPSRPDLTGLN